MIKVKVELWPFGSEADKRTLGEMVIWNDGTGTPGRGNYKFSWWRGERVLREQMREPRGELKDFPRLSYSVFELIKRCLNSAKRV